MTTEEINKAAEEHGQSVITPGSHDTLYSFDALQKIKREVAIHSSKAGAAFTQPEIERLQEALQQCAEVLNLLASRAGIQTEDAALKSDASDDFGALSALRAAREALTPPLKP